MFHHPKVVKALGLSKNLIFFVLLGLIAAGAQSQPWEGLFQPAEPLGDGTFESCPDFDYDGDGEPEAVILDPNLPAGSVSFSNAGGAGPDVIHIGHRVGQLASGSLAGFVDLDGDGDLEAIVRVTDLAAGTLLMEPTGSDPEVIWVSGSAYLGAADIDGDGDEDLAIYDSTVGSYSASTASLTGPGFDVIWVGSNSSEHGFEDLDGDGEIEMVLGDGSLPASTSIELDIDGDDLDIVWAGGIFADFADLDGDGTQEALFIRLGTGATQLSVTGGSGPDLIFAGGLYAGSVDIDGDNEPEAIFNAFTGAAGTLTTAAFSGPDVDVVLAGTVGGGGAVGAVDFDGDGETELLVESATAAAESVTTFDLGGASPDVLVVATQGGKVGTLFDLEGDGELEVLIIDPVKNPRSVKPLDFDFLDMDVDFIFAGSLGQGALTVDFNGDGKEETVLDDPTLAAGTRSVVAFGHGADVTFAGTQGGGQLAGLADIDGDGTLEVAIEAAGLTSPVLSLSLAPGTPDLVFIHATSGSHVIFASDFDGDGADEFALEDPNASAGTVNAYDVVAGDPGVLTFGVGLGKLAGAVDLDGDGDSEALVQDLGAAAATFSQTPFPAASHPAAVIIGTADGSSVDCRFDLDGDGEDELLIPTQDLNGGATLTGDIDGADVDLVFAGTGESTDLELTSPNGGESLTIASFFDITWTAPTISGKIRIELSRDGGATWELLKETANDGLWSWRVTGPGTAAARLRLSSVLDPAIVDESDGDFSIPVPFLELTSPAAGESWPIGTLQSVEWTLTGIDGPTRLELSRDDGVTWELIQDNNPNDGVRAWWVEGSPTTTARFRIASYWEPSYEAVSAAFEIPTPQVTVGSPNGGESYSIGGSTTITWSMTDLGGAVRIELSRDGGTTWEILDAARPNNGQRPWIGIPGPATTHALIRVTSVTDPTYFDISDGTFTIASP